MTVTTQVHEQVRERYGSKPSGTRFGVHVEVVGDRSVHSGLFPCGPNRAARSKQDEADCGCC